MMPLFRIGCKWKWGEEGVCVLWYVNVRVDYEAISLIELIYAGIDLEDNLIELRIRDESNWN